MRLCELINELQNIQDRFGDCFIEIACSKNDILCTYDIDRVVFLKDGEMQRAIIVEV